MNRRATLATLIGRKGHTNTQNSTFLSPPGGPTLDPYTDEWTYDQAAHLLRRAMFAPTHAQIKAAVEKGLDATIEELFQDLPMPEPPLNSNSEEDPNVPIGETWIDAPYLEEVAGQETIDLREYRHYSLRAWSFGLMLTEGVSLREKMTLFWHNHFAIHDVEDPKYLYRHIQLLRANAWGNFRELIKAVTIDPAMLRMLNGNQNNKYAPNENYARELLELHTVGKGDQVGPGDYTTFTEQDVVEIARALTGWRDRGHLTTDSTQAIEVYFDVERHDSTTKQLSPRFNNAVIHDAGEDEYKQVIDIVFQHPEAARYICRKLYRWFIYYKIDEATEQNVIEPMAQILISNDFDIKPVLEAFLKSNHFFNILSVGPLIKNPIDHVISGIKTFGVVSYPEDLKSRYEIWYRVFDQTPRMQMEYFSPPEVAGWKEYYQAPAYYRLWINASTLPMRMNFTNTLILEGLAGEDVRLEVNVLDFIKTLDDPYDPNKIIEDFAKILCPKPLTSNQIKILKEILLPGLPDYEWGVEYTNYEANPNDMDQAMAIDQKLRQLLRVMMNLPEFFLS